MDPNIQIEVLTPDLWGGAKSLEEKDKLQKERLKMILDKKFYERETVTVAKQLIGNTLTR